MLGCDKTITLVRHIETADSDNYATTVINGVGYTEEAKLQQDGKAVACADIVTVTIPQDAIDITPSKDDHIVLGKLDKAPDMLSNLKECGMPVYRIISVNDYRGDILGHWELIGS